MKTQINVIKKQEILAEVTKLIGDYAMRGYVVLSGNGNNGWPRIWMKKGEEIIEVEAEELLLSTHKLPLTTNKVEIKVSGEVVKTYYQINSRNHGDSFDNAYVATLEELKETMNLRMSRYEARRVDRVEKELPVRPLLSLIRKVPGFKSVAIKNLRVTRLPGRYAYQVENVTTRNVKTLELVK